jgi:perosamine synthetase
MISIAQPLLGEDEETAIHAVIRSGQLAQGERVAAFERQFAALCQVKEAVAVSSGTAALYLALLAHQVGPGDEVITTAFTFAATANAIVATGATPVFIDIESETYTLDVAQVEAALSPRTKVILPIHLYGHPANMPQLAQLAAAHRLVLIEDACQAHGALIDGKSVGSFGTGCFSFYATKNMTTGEGGMITTNDPEIAARVRSLRNHGQQERYYHTTLGYNLRMTEMQAALGLVQLAKLAGWNEQRIANARFLSRHLQDLLTVPIVRPGCLHVYHQYTIRVPLNQDREAWINALRAQGIATAVHYALPVYRQPFYMAAPALFRVVPEELPITELAARQVLSLPVHPALSEEHLYILVEEVRKLCA